MTRQIYQGTAEYNGCIYHYSATIDKPGEITTLTIQGKELEDFIAAHGLLLSEPVDWNNPQTRDAFLAKTVQQNVRFQTTIGKQIHEEVVRELEAKMQTP